MYKDIYHENKEKLLLHQTDKGKALYIKTFTGKRKKKVSVHVTF